MNINDDGYYCDLQGEIGSFIQDVLPFLTCAQLDGLRTNINHELEYRLK